MIDDQKEWAVHPVGVERIQVIGKELSGGHMSKEESYAAWAEATEPRNGVVVPEGGVATPAIDRKTQVRITATTLAEVWAFACQSGEFVGIIGQLADAGAGRCGWGVLHTMLDRMGITDQGERNAIVLELAGVADRAAGRLGYGMDGIQGANDAGCTLAEIGAAIQAEIDSGLMREYV